jgi:hypothetical protein
MKSYHINAVQDDWRFLSAQIRARSEKEAKKKFRRRFKGVRDVQVEFTEEA